MFHRLSYCCIQHLMIYASILVIYGFARVMIECAVFNTELKNLPATT